MPAQDPKPSSPKLTRRQVLKYSALGVGGLALGGIFTSSGLRVVRQELRLPRWDANGFKVVQISDVHVNNSGLLARAQEAVQLAVAEKPDLIVFTGDFVNKATPEALSNVRKAFEGLHQADCPCYAVFGNHDYWSEGVPALIEAVASTPLKLLRNEVVDVDGISLAGIDDAIQGHHQPNIIRDKSKFSKSLLVLLHEPDFVNLVPKHASLQLSGHSHGGEICLPGGIVLHTPRGAWKYTSGYYKNAHVPLYVSHGVATLAPFRAFCPPDITVFTLNSA